MFDDSKGTEDAVLVAEVDSSLPEETREDCNANPTGCDARVCCGVKKCIPGQRWLDGEDFQREKCASGKQDKYLAESGDFSTT